MVKISRVRTECATGSMNSIYISDAVERYRGFLFPALKGEECYLFRLSSGQESEVWC